MGEPSAAPKLFFVDQPATGNSMSPYFTSDFIGLREELSGSSDSWFTSDNKPFGTPEVSRLGQLRSKLSDQFSHREAAFFHCRERLSFRPDFFRLPGELSFIQRTGKSALRSWHSL
jgi:hypothetical protein